VIASSRFARRPHADAAGLEEVPEHWSTFSLECDTFGTAQTWLNWICRRPNDLSQWLRAGTPR